LNHTIIGIACVLFVSVATYAMEVVPEQSVVVRDNTIYSVKRSQQGLMDIPSKIDLIELQIKYFEGSLPFLSLMEKNVVKCEERLADVYRHMQKIDTALQVDSEIKKKFDRHAVGIHCYTGKIIVCLASTTGRFNAEDLLVDCNVKGNEISKYCLEYSVSHAFKIDKLQKYVKRVREVWDLRKKTPLSQKKIDFLLKNTNTNRVCKIMLSAYFLIECSKFIESIMESLIERQIYILLNETCALPENKT
jgi:hypothetical protein